MDVLALQACQLSRNNDTDGLFNTVGPSNFLGELSSVEGALIPFCIRTGPMSKPDLGVMKRYEAVEINGEGVAFVMVWIQNRLVAWGTLHAQEAPKRTRRLNIPVALRDGYDIDLYIAHQGRLTGYEVFYEILGGGEG